MSNKTDHDAFERTAYRMRKEAQKNGKSITQTEAKKIVSHHLNRADNKRKRG